jgi:hypothetical protein
MAYTTIDDPTIYFNTKLYTGNASTQSITGVGFQPDWIWIKVRNYDNGHQLFDSVRGTTKRLQSDTDGAEATRSSSITSFDSDGFSMGADAQINDTSSYNYVSWNWKAGTAFSNDASATGVGSIDSSGSVNETAGFSIVSYTGTGSAATIKHGLSTTPNMMIIKNRVTSSKDWQVYSPVNDPTDALALNQSDATGDSDVYWNDTAPTSSVFSVKSGATNTSGAATIGYIFSNRQGYSKMGSFTGNANADGPVLYTGFRPAWFLVKNTAASEHWRIYDNKRNTFNHMFRLLNPNVNSAESTVDNGSEEIDFLSNGVKIRSSAQQLNGSGHTLIYMAFAESPFVNSNGVPNNAR